FDMVAGVDEETFPGGHQVFAFDPRLAADDDDPLAAFAFVEDFDLAIDFGDDGRILRLTGFADLGDSRQTAGDVRHPAGFTGVFGQHGTGLNRRSILNLDDRAFGQVLDVDRLAGFIFDGDLRVQFALVLDDDHPVLAAGFAFAAHRDPFDDVVKADAATEGGDHGDRVGVPAAPHVAIGDLVAIGPPQFCSGGDDVRFDLTAAIVDNADLAVPGQDDVEAFA